MDMNRRKTDPKPAKKNKPNIIINLLSAGFYLGLLLGGGLLMNLFVNHVNESWEEKVAAEVEKNLLDDKIHH